MSPESIFNVVVLPAPLGPRNATISPGSIEKLTSSTARTVLYSRLYSPFNAPRRPSFFWKTR